MLTFTFTNSAACEADPEIARIAEVADHRERATALFAYLENWVPPVDADALPQQVPTGFRFGIGGDGQLTLAIPDGASDRQAGQLHAILQEEVAEVLSICPTGPNQGFGHVGRMLDRYRGALGAGVDDFVPAVLWNAGNKLRLELASDAARTGTALDDRPRLPEDLRDGVAALVAVHNAFVSGHETLAALDAVRQDPVDRHRSDLDRDDMAAFLAVLEQQRRLIVGEVFDELRALHEQTTGETAAAIRALEVERDSLDNLINRAVREALIQERSGLSADITRDAQAAGVGAAAGVVLPGAAQQVGPFVAATFPQLVTALQPQMAALLACSHGADYPVRQAVDYVVWRVRQRVRGTVG